MSARAGAIVELDGSQSSRIGQERRTAVAIAFALCLAIGAAAISRDKPAVLVQAQPVRVLELPSGLSDVTLVAFPDRLANEPPPPLPFRTVRVRGTEGLAVATPGLGLVPTLYWTEGGFAYWLTSTNRDLHELIAIAESLR